VPAEVLEQRSVEIKVPNVVVSMARPETAPAKRQAEKVVDLKQTGKKHYNSIHRNQ